MGKGEEHPSTDLCNKAILRPNLFDIYATASYDWLPSVLKGMKVMADFKSRKKQENYEPLHELLPLKAPFSILIDSTSICNFKCFYCPMSTDKNKDISNRVSGHIKPELFRKIVDDIGEFETKIKMLELGMHGEPFANPSLAENIAYAKKSGFFEKIGVVTNGSLLTPKRSLAVVEAGIDQIDISLNGTSDEHFKEITQTKVSFDKFVKNLTFLFQNRKNTTVTIKMMNESLTKEQKEVFLHTFDPITDQIFLEHLVPYWNEALDYDWPETDRTMLDEEVHPNAEVCPFPFYKMRITSDGKALLCSADWDHLRPIGNLKVQSVKEIWDSKLLRDIQLKFLNQKRGELEGCKTCQNFRYTQLVYLDPYREKILENFNAVEMKHELAR
jgi:MoaA/NifB/PqqE/SkfB family radical SAM enzyme